MTVMRTWSPRDSSTTVPKMMLASGSTALATRSAASLISWMPRSLEPAMESRTRVAPSTELSSSGLEMAC